MDLSFPLPPILIAHVVCGAAATLVLLPLGVLIPRYARAFSGRRWWFPVHAIVQLAGIVLALVALGTGFNMGGVPGSVHPDLGIVLAVGFGLQILLGSFVHWYKGKLHPPVNTSGRGYLHYVHIGLGLVVIIIGWTTALTGFLQEWSGGNGAGGGRFIMGWKIIFGITIGVSGLAYLIGVFALTAKTAAPAANIETPTVHNHEMKAYQDITKESTR